MKQKAKGSKKNRKWGRHSKRSQAHTSYKAAMRDVVNKARKLIQQVWYFPADLQAKLCLDNLIRTNVTSVKTANNQLTSHRIVI